MQTEFTPVISFFGGTLIGLAAIILMAANGRIAGISGIIMQLLPPSINRANITTCIAFIAGLLVAAPILKLATGSPPTSTAVASPLFLVVAGLLVGFGTGTGNGCTSGHGVCGLSRFSIRSLVATITFIVTGGITVYVIRHLIG